MADDAPAPPTLDEQSSTRGSVTVSPSLFPPAGGVARLTGQASRRHGLTTMDDDRQFYREFEGPVALERWENGDWHTVTALQTEVPSQPSDHGNVTVVIPELPVGTYRLVRHHRSVGDLCRVIWITDALSGIEQGGSDGSTAP